MRLSRTAKLLVLLATLAPTLAMSCSVVIMLAVSIGLLEWIPPSFNSETFVSMSWWVLFHPSFSFVLLNLVLTGFYSLHIFTNSTISWFNRLPFVASIVFVPPLAITTY